MTKNVAWSIEYKNLRTVPFFTHSDIRRLSVQFNSSVLLPEIRIIFSLRILALKKFKMLLPILCSIMMIISAVVGAPGQGVRMPNVIPGGDLLSAEGALKSTSNHLKLGSVNGGSFEREMDYIDTGPFTPCFGCKYAPPQVQRPPGSTTATTTAMPVENFEENEREGEIDYIDAGGFTPCFGCKYAPPQVQRPPGRTTTTTTAMPVENFEENEREMDEIDIGGFPSSCFGCKNQPPKVQRPPVRATAMPVENFEQNEREMDEIDLGGFPSSCFGCKNQPPKVQYPRPVRATAMPVENFEENEREFGRGRPRGLTLFRL